jgi:hypothetical protein
VETIHAKRLLKLADFLRTVPQREFNMCEWYSRVKEGEVCKTAACAAGWACSIPSFRRAGLRLDMTIWEDEDHLGRKTKCLNGDVQFEPRTETDRRVVEEVRYENRYSRERDLTSLEAAQAFFGLTHEQAVDLFTPGAYGVNGKVTRKMVISRIRKLVKDNRPGVLKAWDKRKRAEAAA